MNHLQVRERFMPLPNSEDGYSQVLLLGTTGAGKTTVARQLLGTDPKRERFPSTSTAKTTVADTEIIPADVDEYSAVVTFVPRIEVEDYLFDNVIAACVALDEGRPDDQCFIRLLDHESQRFRLSYLLGRPRVSVDDVLDDEDENLDDVDDADDLTVAAGVSDSDLDRSVAFVRGLVEDLRGVVESVRRRVPRTESEDGAGIGGTESGGESEFDTALYDALVDSGTADSVIGSLVEEILKRFSMIGSGRIEHGEDDWPLAWTYSSVDRREFLRVLSLFYGNSAKMFGTLLSPLADGIRVKGRFVPAWSDRPLRFVLLDGEGLGHKASSTVSLPSSLVRKIDECDTVLLVDNAQQPMQAAPIAAMSQIAEMGAVAKLRILFTHLDAVKGDNLPGFAARKEHVASSVTNALSALEGTSSAAAVRTLRRTVDQVMYFVGHADRVLGDRRKADKVYRAQLEELASDIERVHDPLDTGDARVEVERRGISFAVEAATRGFQEQWRARLGLGTVDGVRPEHWSRIKALSRRLAKGMAQEYDGLQPVDDLRTSLQREFYNMLAKPVGWRGQEADEAERQKIVDDVSLALNRHVMDLAERRVALEPHDTWVAAYGLSGRGSSVDRSRMLADGVVEQSAPVPSSTPSPEAAALMAEVEKLFEFVSDEEGLSLR